MSLQRILYIRSTCETVRVGCQRHPVVVPVVTFQDWLKIDEEERRNGAAEGRERRKFVSILDMLETCNRQDVKSN